MAAEAGPRFAPSDAESRARILGDLETNFLVEAAAGTGKTTSLVGRIAAVLREGRAEIDQIAAVTFTRKAAAQLRERLAAQLEAEVAAQGDGEKRQRLERARRRIDRAFLGTIHAFCARLLRERPVEAEIDPEFREIEEDESALLRSEIWQHHLDWLHDRDDQTLARLQDMGIDLRHLEQTYERVADYPEVTPVHAPVPPPDFSDAVREAEALLEEVIALLRGFGREHTPDAFSAAVWRAWFFRANADLSRPAEAAEFLSILRVSELTQKDWPDPALARRVNGRRKEVQEGWIKPALERWYAHRHYEVMRLVVAAAIEFRKRRLEAGRPSFTDLLVLSRNMLREHPAVRAHFQERFTRLFVDEFQDTDPLQAEVMLYLTGSDLAEKIWKNITPRPGSLFVVGDPKQSIYRFRRADIDTYRAVRDIIVESGGAVLRLSRTFRASPPLCEPVNRVFEQIFDGRVPHQAENVPLEPARGARGDLLGVFRLVSAVEGTAPEAVCEADARAVARWIASALAAPLTLFETDADGESRPVRPADFLVILRKTKFLDLYARALEREGVAAEVTGGKAYGDSPEVRSFLALLRAVADPDDPIPLVAFLRGPFCGIDDDALFRFKKAGGRFSYLAEMPPAADPRLARAFRQLGEARELFRSLPPAAAMGRVADLLGIVPGALTDEGGERRAGNVVKTLSAARRLSGEGDTIGHIVEKLGRLVDRSETGEMSIDPQRFGAVRLLNLHKAKGLEAPFVFLAGPHDNRGGKSRDFSIDREGSPPKGHFLVMHRSERGFGASEIARPAAWAELEATEKEYEKAEADRLLYVAATRARNTLVISAALNTEARKTVPSHGVWKDLVRIPIGDLPDLPAPAPALGEAEMPDLAAEFPLAQKAMAAAKTAIAAATGATSSPSKLEGEAVFVPGETAGKGMAWGRILHRLLDLVMRDREEKLDLQRLAENLLRDEERSVDEVAELLETVDRVRRTDLWARARKAPERFIEVPFATVVKSKDYGLPDPPPETLINGAIDLVFKENGVWKLVDYKSDAVVGPVEPLVERYRPQLCAYRDLWSRLTGQPTEAGLWFLASPGEPRWIR